MKRLVVGVIGHVDHGKTMLVHALTGTYTDRLPEEKERGISIALGFASLKIADDMVIDLIDMPGHERFVRTMIAGATGIDAVLLVVAANEGIRPQTVEHINIAALLGLKHALVVVSKCDLVSADEASIIGAEVTALLNASGFVFAPPIMTSALREDGIRELCDALTFLAYTQAPRATDGLAYLPIDRAFSISGHGPVVTGTLRGAPINAADMLELWPSRKAVRVRKVQVNGASVESATPGQRVALNLRDVELADLKRGMSLAKPEAIEASEWLTVALRIVADAPPLKNGKRLRALLGTQEIDARLRLLDRDVCEAGESCFAQLHLAAPVATPAREHVILRLISPAQTVAGGIILEPATRRLKRKNPEILARLELLREALPNDVIASEVAQMGREGLSLQHLSQLAALGQKQVSALLALFPVTLSRDGMIMRKDELERRKRLLSPRIDPSRAVKVEVRASEIEILLRAGGLTPPRPDEIGDDPLTQAALDQLLRKGILIRAVDRDKHKELLFHHDAIAEAQRLLDPLLAQEPGLLVTEITVALGISRKFAMPLLDHLDTIRFSRRKGDRRTLYAPSSAR